MNEDDQVVIQDSEVTTPQDTVEETTPQSDNASTPSDITEEEVVLGKPKSYWEKLDQENNRLRSGQSTLSKRLARYEKLRSVGGEVNNMPDNSADLTEWAQHPASQELLLKAAETEMKEGLDEILADYPNVSPDLVKAIKANPRGFVNPGTIYVDDALLDIENYISQFSQGEVKTPQKPKEFTVVGNNNGASASGDPKVNELLELFKTKDGINKAFARLTIDRDVSQKTFDKALGMAEKMGLL